ncbi:MAG: hypothetical protein V4659_05045 [Pseudomonadota bacterium]
MQNRIEMAGLSARCLGIALAFGCPLAARAETVAGTAIVNVADLAFTLAGDSATTRSNPASIVVAERLDLTFASVGGGGGPAADGVRAYPLRLTNVGNGSEQFAVTASLDGAAAPRLARDGDGDGRYDPARDPDLVDGATSALAPGEPLLLFALVPAGAAGTLSVTARAATGSGAPGTLFAGAGDGGGDALVGPTGAAATLEVPLGDETMPSLVKTASVTAPDGSPRAVRGSIIAYTLVAVFPAATEAARLDDPVPSGTAYRPGTLTLDDAPLSDAADADPGSADAARVRVVLGDVAAGTRRTIRFQVKIQ